MSLSVYFQAASSNTSLSVTPAASTSAGGAISAASTSLDPNISSTSLLTSGSATATNSASKKSNNVSSGAAAGIAIGCLVAGALVAGIIFWFCWRKRKANGARDHEASRIALMPAHEKGFAANTVPLGSGSSVVSPVSAALPLPLEDKAISGEISKIANSVKNHVQSYYQNGRVSPGLIDVDDIHAIGDGQPISAGTLSTLLGNTATREIALRFCIAWAVCSRMPPGADPKASLLPQEVAGCVQRITPQQGGSSVQNASALARWRVMTAELSQASYVRQPFTNADSRNASIQAALAVLENVLQPFADSRMDNSERRRNLEEILKRSALFAFTLFSQPSTWGFDCCEKQGVKSGELCIFPALVQLSDENGQVVSPPRPFSEAVIRRLSE
ncbi:hypothetical protein DE146DRAFT_601416 [Phaeosphaeria sp. MPI-PUGE-AT-0046c]|nr:hypothetical protein DE146DRAFT_601416 [Phaeosphaeria sp. MPI-PUGE-AT-0046c]